MEYREGSHSGGGAPRLRLRGPEGDARRSQGNWCPSLSRWGSWCRDTGTCDRAVSAGATISTWTGEVAGSRGATGQLVLCSRSLAGRCGSSRYIVGSSMVSPLKADMGQHGHGSSGHKDQEK